MARSRRDPALLTSAEAAREIGCSKRTVLRMIDAGELAVAAVTPGGQNRIARATIEAMREGEIAA